MKVSTLAIAALLAVATPAAVLAQAAPATPQVDAGAAAGAAAELTDFNAFLQGFGSADFTAAASEISTATQFQVVKLSTLQNADPAALDTTIKAHEADIAGLRTGISANAAATAALEAEALTADQVVWVETGADGMVKLYVNDLAAPAM